MTREQRNQFWIDLVSGEFAVLVKATAPGKYVHNAQELFNVFKPILAGCPDREQLWGVFLTAKNEIITIECLAVGTLTMSQIYPREVVKMVLAHHAAAFLLVHNHPSGDSLPSPDDLRITRALYMALATVGATFHDHLIVGREVGYSMGDKGDLGKLRREYTNFVQEGLNV